MPRCSCKIIKSDSPAELAEATRLGRIRLPRFRRMEVGRSRRSSLANAARREEGEREVVMRMRGSTMPLRWAYSSSIERLSGWDSSYL